MFTVRVWHTGERKAWPRLEENLHDQSSTFPAAPAAAPGSAEQVEEPARLQARGERRGAGREKPAQNLGRSGIVGPRCPWRTEVSDDGAYVV